MALLTRRVLATLVLVALAEAGCVRDPVDLRTTDTRVALVGLVLAGADSISIALARIEPERGPMPELGALLRISTAHGTTTLSERAGTECGLSAAFACHRAALEPLGPADHVVLAATLASGIVVDGETVVPSPPILELEDGSPLPDTLRLTGDLRSPPIVATSNTGRIGIVGGDLPGTVEVDGRSYPCTFASDYPAGIDFTRFDLILRASIGECVGIDSPVEWDRATVAMDLIAFDASYVGYLASFGDEPVFLSDSQWGVAGVIGVFGSAAPRRVVLVADR